MYPQEQVRIERVIVVPPNARVSLIDRSGGGQRGLSLTENDRHRHQHGAAETPDGMSAEVRMIVDPRRHLGVRQLHQQRTPTTQQEDVLAADAPGYRIVSVKAGQVVALSISALKSSR